MEKFELRKKASVEPDLRQPYGIFVCFDKSSADSIGLTIRSTVKKAAKLAVYDETSIRMKNHQLAAKTRVDNERGIISQPCCIRQPIVNQSVFFIEKLSFIIDDDVVEEDPILLWMRKKEKELFVKRIEA